MKSNILIYSQGIRSGKTSTLISWVSDNKKTGGVLCPDLNGRRKLLDIGSGIYYSLQLSENTPGVSIGKFVFDEAILEKGQELIEQAVYDPAKEWLIIDEIGRLEMDRRGGLEPMVSKAIEHFQKQDTGNKKLILVIRDYLLDKAIVHYQLQKAGIVSSLFFKEHIAAPLIGVALCGGESSRMGKSKALLEYHSMPQYEFLASMLSQFTEEVYLSANELYPDNPYAVIKDKEVFEDAGPMSGLLSVMQDHPGKAVLIAACDYPYLKRQDILELIRHRNKEHPAVCFRHPESGMYEPLIAVFEPECFPTLKVWYEQGNTSLRKFLEASGALAICPRSPLLLHSMDTPEDFQNFDLKKYYDE